AVLFLIMLLRGKAYAELVSGLDEEKYPLASLYTVGFAWAATGFGASAGFGAGAALPAASLSSSSSMMRALFVPAGSRTPRSLARLRSSTTVFSKRDR
ncbi:MAG: hypothetical protein IJ048_06025, partial [Clostridia bacterium]|nr:hypothetical protein [Clostridia bacterium]